MRLAAAAILWGTVAASYLSGAFHPFDAALLDLQYRLAPRQASGDVAIVKIDPKSLATLDRWPWSRAEHAQLTDRLIAAGARLVVFDIDFSSHSNPEADTRLAQAFHDADGRIVLPVFKQYDTSRGAQVVYSAPLEVFQREARLGAVTVQPETDGRIWHGLTSDLWKGWRLPTIPGLLAGHGGDRDPRFLIDYGIDPKTIPQFSYVDVLSGKFDPAAIAGKTVLVGATAVELGDHYAVPLYADLPGVVIQGLSYESLKQNVALRDVPPIWILLLSLLVMLPASAAFRRVSWRVGALAGLGIALSIWALNFSLSAWLKIYVPSATPIVSVALAYFIAIVQRVDLQAIDIFNHQLEATQRRVLMKTVVESSSDGIVIAEETGSVSMLNPAAAEMIGIEAAAAVGAQVATLLPSGGASDSSDPLRIGTHGKWDTELSPADGAPLTVEITVAVAEIVPTRNPLEWRRRSRRVFIYALHDITERKKVEEAQRVASAAAIANNRAKTEFLTNMSHELRTPLNAVLGFSEMIRDELLGPLGDKRYGRYAKDIHDAGSHLLAIINDILSISRIELGEMRMNESEIDVGDAVEAVIRLIELRAEEKSITIERRIPAGLPPLMADERAVKQVLLNILANAVKFTDRGGRVRVSVHAELGGPLLIAIADNGIGIPRECIEKVAEPFYQVDSSLQRNHEGLGLGLAIVRDLMALLGGQVSIDSEPGLGTTVTLSFPASRLLTAEREAVAAEPV